MNQRTRIKICGLSRPEDISAAVGAGADAIGLVFYPKSPRFIEPQAAARLLAALPPYLGVAGLFVNASEQEVLAISAKVPLTQLQFHGDETPQQCATIAQAAMRPFTRALRITADMSGADLLEYESAYRLSSPLFSGLILDTFVDGYGGGGKVFDWSLIPKELAPRVVLSGGLSVQNVAEAIASVRPYAVDVSSGVEASRGIKDPARIRDFIAAVRRADQAVV
ncbi:phosphoribosylanthranilate isomerase [Noviherbaspirillum humi]|uniref:N-(5'-phosphoribosyl)anthranilate isomerase n=1 Tax=Noviherbaspirillum humi TaxID=1688639 RepID=A0A239KSU1_9BURK|nr:phosphoribosylanthranilate isomerase [Noviherbaspirillum humi]SNT20748.1 phosphoribosylanthranilate isomerase [Noviherbaspirillum humi]